MIRHWSSSLSRSCSILSEPGCRFILCNWFLNAHCLMYKYLYSDIVCLHCNQTSSLPFTSPHLMFPIKTVPSTFGIHMTFPIGLWPSFLSWWMDHVEYLLLSLPRRWMEPCILLSLPLLCRWMKTFELFSVLCSFPLLSRWMKSFVLFPVPHSFLLLYRWMKNLVLFPVPLCSLKTKLFLYNSKFPFTWNYNSYFWRAFKKIFLYFQWGQLLFIFAYTVHTLISYRWEQRPAGYAMTM